MNFFKSILLEDSDSDSDSDSEPPKPEKPHVSELDSSLNRNQDPDNVAQAPGHTAPPSKLPDSDSSDDDTTAGGGGWSFGGLIKTITTRSESVLETYRRDLQEFGSGLRKETDVIREVASRAVKDLPSSLEASASAAHGSLELVGHALDGVLKSTADIISQGKDTLLSGSDGESETPDANRSLSSGRYSRYEAQLTAIQSDTNTFSKEPEDLEEYQKWKLGFKLEDKSDEIDGLIGENGVLEGTYKKVVPSTADEETFWCRYFYRVHKLKQQESVRANLVKRAISVDDDEELSWDVEDDEDDIEKEEKGNLKVIHTDEPGNEDLGDENLVRVEKQEGSNNELENKKEGNHSTNDGIEPTKKSGNNVSSDEKVKSEEIVEVKNVEKVNSEEKNDEKVVKSNEKVAVEAKGNTGKESEVSGMSSHQSSEEEDDLGWDEIEDLGSNDEKKVTTTNGGSPNRADLRNQLSIAEEDEDLSWDIEEDGDDGPEKKA